MNRTRVAVLRGGPSREYEVSLKTGASILKHLDEEKYLPNDILITKEGQWHSRGLPVAPRHVLETTDVVVNALHGEYGEDGTVQKLLDYFSVPYTGSGAAASALGMNKLLAKGGLRNTTIKMPRHHVYKREDTLEPTLSQIFSTLGEAVVCKPVVGGSSVGVSIAKSYPELVEGVRYAFEHSPSILLEEFIDGREATCGVVEQFNNQAIWALAPIEIIPPADHSFFDYQAKYSGETQELCPGNFSKEESEELRRLAVQIHETLGLSHYSRSDFIVSPQGIYFLEVNTLPALTSISLLPKAVEEAGLTLSQFLDHLVTLALERA